MVRVLTHILCFLSIANILCESSNKCPCDLSRSKPVNRSIVYCFIVANDQKRIIENIVFRDQIRVRFHPSGTESNSCDVIFDLLAVSSFKLECPGQCSPPMVKLPLLQFLQAKMARENAILCSYTFNMLKFHTNYLNDSGKELGELFDELFERRYQECHERREWTRVIPAVQVQNIKRRRVNCIIIWIGSNSRWSLLHNQNLILKDYPVDGENATIGWSVSEDIFPCHYGTTICPNASIYGDFMPMMPKTFLGSFGKFVVKTNMSVPISFGWACAQRRPLRALAHALELFDPNYIILADDDTYINLGLLENAYDNLLRKEMYHIPLVIGHYILRKKLTLRGLLFGGTGYILGKNVLNRLVAKEVRHMRPKWRDKYTSELLLLREMRLKERYCTTGSCLLRDRPINNTVPSASRLVDICTSMMASEYTCYHSDYSMSRCLFYGANVEVVAVTCSEYDYPKMCSRNTSRECDLRFHLSCHGWMPNNVTLLPVPIPLSLL